MGTLCSFGVMRMILWNLFMYILAKELVLSDGSTQIENNNSRIPERDLKKILAVIEAYSDYIISKWEFYFGEKAKFKDI